MQNKVYLAFKHPNQHDTTEKPTSGLEDFIVRVLEALVPVGNPDFEEQLAKVATWTIEYDKENNGTLREIGYGINGKILLILPLNDNLGYWANNNLSLEEYYALGAKEISDDQFEKDWTTYKTVGV